MTRSAAIHCRIRRFTSSIASASIRLRPVGPGGVSVLAKMYFTPTGDSFTSPDAVAHGDGDEVSRLAAFHVFWQPGRAGLVRLL